MRLELISLLGARGGSVLIQAGLLLWVARNTAPADFGAFMAAVAVSYVVVAVGDGGLQPMAIRDRAGDRSERPHGGTEAFRVASVSTFVIAALAALVLPFVDASMSVGHAVGIAFIAWLERQFLGRLSLAIAEGRSVATSVLLLVARGTTAAVLVPMHFAGVQDQIGAYLVASIVGLGASLVLASTLFPQQMGAHTPWKTLVTNARPFWLSNVWSQLRGVDAFVIGAVSSPTAVANYALPNRLGQALRIVPSVLSSLGQPAAVQENTLRLKQLDVGTSVAVLGGVGLWVLVAVMGEPVFLALVGAEYADAFGPLLWVLGAQIINIPGIYLAGVLIGGGHESDVARLDAAVTLLLLTAITLGAITYGAMGASAGLFVGLACQSLGAVMLRLKKGWY